MWGSGGRKSASCCGRCWPRLGRPPQEAAGPSQVPAASLSPAGSPPVSPGCPHPPPEMFEGLHQGQGAELSQGWNGTGHPGEPVLPSFPPLPCPSPGQGFAPKAWGCRCSKDCGKGFCRALSLRQSLCYQLPYNVRVSLPSSRISWVFSPFYR